MLHPIVCPNVALSFSRLYSASKHIDGTVKCISIYLNPTFMLTVLVSIADNTLKVPFKLCKESSAI